jgi:hypothetical protein
MTPIVATPELGVRLLEGDAEHAALLRHIDAANPPTLKRAWTGKGRQRKSTLEGLTEVAQATVLHLPWFQVPVAPPNRRRWMIMATLLAWSIYGAGFLLVLFVGERLDELVPRLMLWTALGGSVAGIAVMAAYHQRRVRGAQRTIPSKIEAIHGLIATHDTLLVRFPDVAYEVPRDRIRRFRVADKSDIAGKSTMAAFALLADVSADDGSERSILLDEVVESTATALDQSARSRLAVLYAAADWLNDTWLVSTPKSLSYRDEG